MGRHKKEQEQSITEEVKEVAAVTVEEEPYSGQGIRPEFITRGWDLAKKSIENKKAELIKGGSPANVVNNNLGYEEKEDEKYFRRAFLARITSPETGQWFDLPSLKAIGKISKEDHYTFDTYPFLRVTQLRRYVTANNEDYLVRMCTLYGLDMNGNEVWNSISYLDHYEEPTYHYEKVPTEGNDFPKIARIARKEGTRRVFLNKFTPEKVLEAIEKGTKPGDTEKIGLSVYYERSPYWHNSGLGVQTIEQFIKPFDELWKEIDPQQPKEKQDTVRLDKKDYQDFLDFMKYKKNIEGHDNHHIQ